MRVRYRVRNLRRWCRERAVGILGILAILSLTGAVYAITQYTQLQADRDQDRHELDLQRCETGNGFRRDVIAIADAGEALHRAVIQVVIGDRLRTDEQRMAFAELLVALAPSFEDYEDKVDRIELTDCATVFAP